ncbi:hypothetical protein BD414DRAFT_461442 [Trametes punicea]|nr:hypothetical protein BD414DRAFT_461442 [Trametes punicea]
MIDEKFDLPPQFPPPAYGSPPQDAVGTGSGPQGDTAAPPYPTQQGPFIHQQQTGYGPPPPAPSLGKRQGQSNGGPGAPLQGPGAGGYPPQAAGAAMPGAQYQERLMAMCASGNHDIEKHHGIAGIIGAIICFPIGLLCLLLDVEKRCVRCGVRVV